MSILCGAATTDEAARRMYMERFCDQYTRPLVDYLRFARAVPTETAEDIVQEFWTAKLFAPGPSGNLIAKYLDKRAENSALGFRRYLGRSLSNFFIDHVRHRDRRGGAVSLEAIEGWEPQAETADPNFDVVWASHILNDVVNSVRLECEQLGQLEMWLLFVQYTLSPSSESNHGSLANLAAEHGFETAKQASNALQTISRKFRRTLKNRIADYLPIEDLVEAEAIERQEIEQLLQILSQPGGVSADILRLETILLPSEHGDSTLSGQYPSAASFRLTNLAPSERDYGVLWLAFLDNKVTDWLSESLVECRPEWQTIKLSDLPNMGRPDLELLKLIRQQSKRLGVEATSSSRVAQLDGTTPTEILAVMYLTAIAIARTQYSERITKSSDSDLKRRIQSALQYSWLDQRTAELFTDLLETL